MAYTAANALKPKQGVSRRRAGPSPDAWALVWGQPYIEVQRLAAAIEHELAAIREDDFRSRLLIRDASRALRWFWGPQKFGRWLAKSPLGSKLQGILEEDLGRPGYRYIRRRLVAATGLDDLKQVLRLLGEPIHHRVEINIAGSIPTLVSGLTARPTDDIDIVDEVPVEIREQRGMLARIKKDYGLAIGHVQSHYLPAGWQARRKSFGDFGGLRVYLLDEYDIFVSKLSSKQPRHMQDLRMLAKRIDRQVARRRLLTHGKAFLAEEPLKRQIEKNWEFLFDEPLRPETRKRRSSS